MPPHVPIISGATINNLTMTIYGYSARWTSLPLDWPRVVRPWPWASHHPSACLDMEGFHRCPQQIVHMTTSSRLVMTTQIPFPHLPSSILVVIRSPLVLLAPHVEVADAISVPHFHKLSFPTFDGKEDPLIWLNR